MNQLQKYLKPVLQKLGTLQFPSPNRFSSPKTDYDKFESWENFSPIPLLGQGNSIV